MTKRRYTHEELLSGDVPSLSLINEPLDPSLDPTVQRAQRRWKMFGREIVVRDENVQEGVTE
jgi:hypothetical protein